MFDSFEFDAEDELNKPLEAGTVANVRLRQRKDKDSGEMLPLGDLQTGETKKDGTPYVILLFEVADGEHSGHWASMILFARPSEWRFRKVYEVVTGVDLKSGGKFDYNDFVDKLKTGIFSAELGPQKPRNPEEPPQYTDVKKIIERVGERDMEAEAAQRQEDSKTNDLKDEVELDDTSDEDIPF
jgi:hypothetical protein